MLTKAPDGAEQTAWFAVVNTHPHREQFASENLIRQGYTPYCPRLVTRVTHARKTRDVLRPMFPGYLFVAFDSAIQQFSPVNSTFGVRRVVKFGERPALLDGNFVQALRQREVDGAIIRPAHPYSVGDPVKLRGSSFDGVIAKIVELADNDRVVVLFDLLQRPTKLTTDVRFVRPLACADA